MSWSDGYLPASFRGVPFSIRKASTVGGRIVSEHQFPGRDETETEDLGGLSKRGTLDAFLVGADYFRQRDRFEDALDLGGVGVLIHPYRGTLNIKINGSWSAVETGDEGGMIRYSIPIVVDSKIKSAIAGTDTRWIARQVKEEYLSSAKENFLDIFSLAQKPANVIRDANAAIDQGLSVIDGAKQIVNSAADFKRQIENTRGKMTAVMLNLEYIADSIIDLVDWGIDEASGENSRDHLRELRKISDFRNTLIGEVKDVDPYSPASQAQMLIAHASLAVQTGLIPDVEFDSYDDATGLRGDMFSDLEELKLNVSVSSDLYTAMRDAKRAVYDDIEGRVLTLPRFVDHYIPGQTNTLSLMWSLYGSLDNEDTFIARNDIEHPGFLPVGVALKVQTDG